MTVICHPDVKVCVDCKNEKPAADFYAYKDGRLYRRCKSCHYLRTQAWRSENREKVRELGRTRYSVRYRDKILARKRFQKYGITQDEYAALMERQNHVCPICLRPFEDSRGRAGSWEIASVDHDHATGEVRGILHRRCNLALELLLTHEDVARARRYLGLTDDHPQEA